MKKIIPIVVCAIFVASVRSECVNKTNCAPKLVNEALKGTSVVENFDITLEVPKFGQIKDVGVEDLNEILRHITNWFENRLNETSLIFKNVNNKTKIFVKSFDFNVDFERGNAKIDVDLAEESEGKNGTLQIATTDVNVTTTQVQKNEKRTETITTTESPKPGFVSRVKNKTEQIKRIIEKLGGERENEVFQIEEFDTTYYDINEDNSTDYPIVDYIEMYKDTTNEENVYTPTETSTIDDLVTNTTGIVQNTTELSPPPTTSDVELDPTCDGDAACIQFTKTVYPWVASIFVTSEDRGSQFSYYCDGALLTEKVIVTGARCISVSNKTWNPENVLVFLGKTNLQIFGGNEKVHKVKSLVLHPNFTLETEGKAASDLALLVLEDAVMFNENIQSACIHQDNSFEEAATTAWGLNGALYPILFNKQKSDQCFDKDEDVFCATYGNDVALCPSYGGIFASRQMDRWCLSGIFHGDPKERGICFNKNVQYTALRNFLKWIDDTVGMYKNGILL
ncbi:uncharacterized protein LOC124642432 isoform X2 [Helicoverpa zea]|uniref:uncharacterized protein LOC124642432 isoform X2 n=1 Tax=Helicoverpa zea TaxID=7113 RepID=UPI001F5A3F6E|nr:uncharacterized protein LOC124642432 isoform X2 [Helicoverpa zea]